MKKKILNLGLVLTLALVVGISFSSSEEAIAQTTTTSTYTCWDVATTSSTGEFTSRVCNVPKCERKKYDSWTEQTTCTVTITSTKPGLVDL
jgi:hypothetical protein